MDNLENINEEYLRMQKMAGIITEEEYKHSSAQLWYRNYAEKLRSNVNGLEELLKSKGYDV